jgi:hypothetical protein
MKKNKDNVVIVYGSGASHGSGYEVQIIAEKWTQLKMSISPPTDQGFFNSIDNKFFKQEYYALWKYKNLYFNSNNNISMEELWSTLDLNNKHITLDTYDWAKEKEEYVHTGSFLSSKYLAMDTINSNFNKQGYLDSTTQYNRNKFLGDCGRDFRRLVYNVYSNYTIKEDSDIFQQMHDAIMRSKSNLLGYITFNYDCYLEHSLRKKKFKYIDANFNATSMEQLCYGAFPIIKLHGSLSWEEKKMWQSYDISFQAPPYDKSKQINPQYNNDDEWAQPAIIPPTIFKQEINDDSRLHHKLTSTILQQWRSAITILQNSDKIIFVGYSFPQTDFHSKRIFQIA